MKNNTKKVIAISMWWAGIIIGIAVFLTAVIMVVMAVNSIRTETAKLQKTSAELQTSPEKFFYENSGDGVVIINYKDNTSLKTGFLKWKNDHPERAEKILSTAIDVTDEQNRIFVLLYKTDKENKKCRNKNRN